MIVNWLLVNELVTKVFKSSTVKFLVFFSRFHSIVSGVNASQIGIAAICTSSLLFLALSILDATCYIWQRSY